LAIADKLAGELFAEGSPADLVERYARKLPLSVICELLGLPLADRPKFMTWANTVSRITGSLVSFWHMMRAYQGEIACWRGRSAAALFAPVMTNRPPGKLFVKAEL